MARDLVLFCWLCGRLSGPRSVNFYLQEESDLKESENVCSSLKLTSKVFRDFTQSWRETSTGAAPPSVRTEEKNGGDPDLGAETGTEDGSDRGPVIGREKEAGPARERRGRGTRIAGAGTRRRGRGSPRVRSQMRPGTRG